MIYKGLDEDESAFLQFVVDKQIEHEDEVVKNELQEVSAYRVSLLVHTHIFIWSDAAATIFFAACFSAATIEGGVYFFGKLTDIKDGWIRYIRAIQWWLLDAVSSLHSLSVLLSAMETSRTTRIALVLAWWPSSEIIRTRLHVLAMATIGGRCLFHSELPIVLPLFVGGVYLYSCSEACWDSCSWAQV